MNLARGTLVLVDLEPTLGHEQQGTRPCVVVSDAAVNRNQRFPLIAVVPVTGTPAQGALHRLTPAGRQKHHHNACKNRIRSSAFYALRCRCLPY